MDFQLVGSQCAACHCISCKVYVQALNLKCIDTIGFWKSVDCLLKTISKRETFLKVFSVSKDKVMLIQKQGPREMFCPLSLFQLTNLYLGKARKSPTSFSLIFTIAFSWIYWTWYPIYFLNNNMQWNSFPYYVFWAMLFWKKYNFNYEI